MIPSEGQQPTSTQETAGADMSEEARSRRSPSVISMVFICFVAVLGLLGATRAGRMRVDLPTAGARGAHLTLAKDYREKAAAAQREAERHRSPVERVGAPAGEALPEALRVRRLRVAAAAAELSRVESELADYHEEQARLLEAATTRAR